MEEKPASANDGDEEEIVQIQVCAGFRKGADLETTSTVMSGEEGTAAEVEAAACDCCGLMEECTPAYIEMVRERYGGRWICGLCGEAVEEEISRSARLISTEEALARHLSFRRTFASAAPPPSPEHLIAAVRQLLRRSLGSPRSVRSTPTSPGREPAAGAAAPPPGLARSESCFPTLAG
ncbi:uncharacterized protein [Typha angustifolia]|uniref:uncharacterized protein n=1 Tax=Typha angustifolia TaxID=59011 RepID=UPI003C306B97